MSDYYTHGSYPVTGAAGRSADMRAELNAIDAGFAKLAPLTGNAFKIAYVNAGATAWDTLGGTGLVKLRTGATPIIAVDGTDYVSPTGAATLTNKTIVVASNTITTAAHGTLAATELNAALAELADDDALKVAKAGDTMTGDLTFSGNGRRVKGDLSNATNSDRLLFQTTTANSDSMMGVIPSGSGNSARWTAYGGADPNNTSFIAIVADESAQLSKLIANASGTGTARALTFESGGSERFRLPASSALFQADFSNATLTSRLRFQSSTTNGSTGVNIIPNGTNTTSTIGIANSSDINNAGYLSLAASSTLVAVGSNLTGTGGTLPVQFTVGGTEAARFDTSRNLNVGSTTLISPGGATTNAGISLNPTAGVRASCSANNALTLQRTTSDGAVAVFYRETTSVGSITVNATNTAYNTSSDYRLKDNIQDLSLTENPGEFLDALRPRVWKWKVNGERGVGFIAHELQEVSPSSVVGAKDAVDAEGKPEYQAVEYGSAEVIAMLVAEVQALRKRVAELEAK